MELGGGEKSSPPSFNRLKVFADSLVALPLFVQYLLDAEPYHGENIYEYAKHSD